MVSEFKSLEVEEGWWRPEEGKTRVEIVFIRDLSVMFRLVIVRPEIIERDILDADIKGTYFVRRVGRRSERRGRRRRRRRNGITRERRRMVRMVVKDGREKGSLRSLRSLRTSVGSLGRCLGRRCLGRLVN